MSLAERDALLARLAARGRAAGIAERRTSFESAMAALWQPGLLPPPVAIAPGVAGRWAPAPPAPGQPVLVWFHGGAFQLGSSASHWGLGRAIADASGAAVLLPDYALAPERPFPAARDDAIAVVEALLAGGLRPHRLALGGDSAGGNLAVAALQHRLARAGAAPAACWLVSPYLDLANSRPSMVARRARDRFVDPDDGTNRIYAGTADPADPAVSPLSGRFDAFPPRSSRWDRRKCCSTIRSISHGPSGQRVARPCSRNGPACSMSGRCSRPASRRAAGRSRRARPSSGRYFRLEPNNHQS